MDTSSDESSVIDSSSQPSGSPPSPSSASSSSAPAVTDNPVETLTLKRFDIIGNHEFIRDGEFSVEHFAFPAMPASAIPLNSAGLSDSILETLDICTILRKVADEIGNLIQGAFYLIPPNSVLRDIAKKFKQDHPQMQLYFDKMKSLPTQQEKLSKFKDVAKCLKFNLDKWKNARSLRLKRHPDALWTYRSGKSQADLTAAYQKRLADAKLKKANAKSVRVSAAKKLLVAEQELLRLKIQNETLLKELNDLKAQQGGSSDIEPFRLRETGPPAVEGSSILPALCESIVPTTTITKVDRRKNTQGAKGKKSVGVRRSTRLTEV